jgi:hypothetical protein
MGGDKVNPSMIRILSLESQPFHLVRYALAEGTRLDDSNLPFLRGFVDRLPDGLDAVIATSDLQGFGGAGRATPLGDLVAREIQRLQARGRLPRAERTACLLAGDLYPRADAGDVRGVWSAMRDASRWVAGVAGNHDAFGGPVLAGGSAAQFARDGMYLLDGDSIEIDGLRIGGVGGIVAHSGARGTRSEHDFATAVGRLATAGVDVLLCHDGPNVGGTKLPGWPPVRHALEAAPATLLIRGHDAWPEPLANLPGGTQVLNVEGRVIVLGRPPG